jgi:hypothetical protein
MNDIEVPESWVPSACTLPSAEQPFRVAEFDELFATSVRSVERPANDRLVLVLAAESEALARNLAMQENECCSFFDFEFSAASSGHVRLMVRVPAGHVEVLDALTARAAGAATGRMSQ